MPTTLEDALGDVDLETGRTYCVRIRGQEIEVRVKPLASPLVFEDQGEMAGAWAELVQHGKGVPCINRAAPLPAFPLPEIPDSEQQA